MGKHFSKHGRRRGGFFIHVVIDKTIFTCVFLWAVTGTVPKKISEEIIRPTKKKEGKNKNVKMRGNGRRERDSFKLTKKVLLFRSYSIGNKKAEAEQKQRRQEHKAQTIEKENLRRKAVRSNSKNLMEGERELFERWGGSTIEERI